MRCQQTRKRDYDGDFALSHFITVVLHSNLKENLNENGPDRSYVIWIFPSPERYLRLMGALAVGIHED